MSLLRAARFEACSSPTRRRPSPPLSTTADGSEPWRNEPPAAWSWAGEITTVGDHVPPPSVETERLHRGSRRHCRSGPPPYRWAAPTGWPPRPWNLSAVFAGGTPGEAAVRRGAHVHEVAGCRCRPTPRSSCRNGGSRPSRRSRSTPCRGPLPGLVTVTGFLQLGSACRSSGSRSPPLRSPDELSASERDQPHLALGVEGHRRVADARPRTLARTRSCPGRKPVRSMWRRRRWSPRTPMFDEPPLTEAAPPGSADNLGRPAAVACPAPPRCGAGSTLLVYGSTAHLDQRGHPPRSPTRDRRPRAIAAASCRCHDCQWIASMAPLASTPSLAARLHAGQFSDLTSRTRRCGSRGAPPP